MNWQKSLRGRVRFNQPLKKHTTFKVGGPARLFIEPRDCADLKLLLSMLKRYKITPLVIGRGSNILASDAGLNRAVIRLSSPFFNRLELKDSCIEAGAGNLLNRVVGFARKHGLSGPEFLAGIPGTVGGALAMNAGAWGKNISGLVQKVTIMDYRGNTRTLKKKDIRFVYRSSSLAKYIILSCRIKGLKKDKRAIEKTIRGYLNSRRMSQDLSGPSAGSVFKNPQGKSAGRLIDLCGLKGKKIGDACISRKHANFIINQGNAQAADILRLMGLIKKRVKDKFRINLQPEIKIWQ
ncbi:MAG: UDP-N-acetylmuramate dehydrogenase [Candidatus Omnitrophota bacterium]|jgi:UDP-N-acetylmuramate dehydrogenase